MKMKHLAALFAVLIIIISAGVCASAADFTVDTSVTPADSIDGKYELPKGEVNKPYSAHIQMAGGNDGYTFRFDDGAFVPAGLSISGDGTITGTPTMSGRFRSIDVYVSHTDGTYKVITFTVELDARHVKLVVTAPENAIYDGFTRYTASAYYQDIETDEILTDVPSIYYIKNGERVDYALEATTYMIRYDIPLALEIMSYEGDEFFTVSRSNIAQITAGDKEVTYDGQPHGLTNEDITVTPAEAGHREQYKLKSEPASAYSPELPTAPGEYDVRVYTVNSNYEPQEVTATLKITAQTVDFTVTNTSVPYNENEQEPTITPSKPDANYTVTYTDSEGNVLEGKPRNAGTYTININVVTNPGDDVIYVKGNVSADTFEITPIEVSLKIPVKSYSYEEGKSYTPEVVPEPAGFTKYSVKYQLLDESGQPAEGAEPAGTISAMGTYAVIFTLNDPVNYVFGTGNAQFVQVAEQTIDYKFTNLNKTYIRDTAQYAGVETTNGDFEGHYTVVYSQNGTQVTPQNAGTYYITVRPDNGYGTGTKDPEYPYLVINQQPVTFSLAEGAQTTVSYDGEGHTVAVQHNAESDIHSDEYNVTYRNKATGDITESAVNAGTYDVIVTVTNNNYKAEAFNATLTVNSTVTLNLGNSPAAMIYKDSAHINDAVWQTATFEQLRTNREFTAENLPENCRTGIKYPAITVNGKDLDTDTSTVIVSSLNTFADPGVVINGEQSISSDSPVPVEGTDGLYKITYTHEGVNYDRYIMVTGRIGDTNIDGYVNALDANYLDNKNDAPNSVTEARVWDVNKDGVLNKDDAAAIRNRFKTKLVPYYPWIYR